MFMSQQIHNSTLSESFINYLYSYMYYTIILFKIFFFFFRLHGKDNVAIKRYVISFWNGIDLRYKLLKDPGVKISIAGIIISRVRIFKKLKM